MVQKGLLVVKQHIFFSFSLTDVIRTVVFNGENIPRMVGYFDSRR